MSRNFQDDSKLPSPREVIENKKTKYRKLPVGSDVIADRNYATEKASALENILQRYTKDYAAQFLKIESAGEEDLATIFLDFKNDVKLQVPQTSFLSQFLFYKYMDQCRINNEIGLGKSSAKESMPAAQPSDSELNYKKVASQKVALEKLSRELQKQYREIQEENKMLKHTESERLKAMEAHFQAYARQLKHSMEKEFMALSKGRDDKNGLKNKFKQFLEEYQIREKHFKAVIQTKDSEYSLIQAKYDLLNEKLMESKEENANAQKSFLTREVELQKQNQNYASKLKEAEETLSKSNELFMTYRFQLDMMTEKLKGLQNEHLLMKKNAQHLEATCTYLKQSIDISEMKNKKLESLCRALQAERQRVRAESTSSETKSEKKL